jgi:hypothetical protein
MEENKQEIVPVEQKPNLMTSMLMEMIAPVSKMTPQTIEALTNLSNHEAPEYAIQTHPGKGGKVMRYVSHVWVTKQLSDAFGMMWGQGVSNPVVYDDGSASVLVTLYVDFPRKDGTTYRRTVTEVGAFDAGGGKLSKAMMIASATSRGLVKCVYRMFRLGENLFEDVPEPTPRSAWKDILKLGLKRGMKEEDIIAIVKGMGVTQDKLLDRFVEVWKAVYDATIDKGDIEDLE